MATSSALSPVVSAEWEAPTSAADASLCTSVDATYLSGRPAHSRPLGPGSESALMALLIAIFVLVSLNIRHVKRLFRTLPQDVLSVRRRENAFDDHTANESRTMLLMIGQLCVYEGILLYLWLRSGGSFVPPTGKVFPTVASLTLVAAAYYVFQLCAYGTVGYVFADKTDATLWRRGLNSSQAILGILLMFPALVSLFYPSSIQAMLVVAATLYLVARLAFISKGFRIFYSGFTSLFYFILYLCTLEILPVAVTLWAAAEVCKHL